MTKKQEGTSTKNTMRRRSAAVLLLLLLAAGCAALVGGRGTFENFRTAFFTKAEVKDTVRIGVLEPQTGGDRGQGELEIRGILIAQQLHPTVLGKEVELVYADTQSNIYGAETAVANLIEQKPAVVLGSYGNAVSLVASRQLGEAQIPAITITATNPLITVNNPYYFSVAYTDARQGSALADFVLQYLKQEQVAVVQVNGEDAVAEMTRRFTSRFNRQTDGSGVQDILLIEPDVKNYSDYVERLRASGVRAVFMPTAFSVLERLLDEMDRQGLSGVTIVGPGTWQEEDLPGLQREHPGIRLAVASDMPFGVQENTPVKPDVKEPLYTEESLYQEFLTAYQKTYGEEQPAEATAQGFDAYMLAVTAIEQAGSLDGTAIRDALFAGSAYTGASGTITFSETGEPRTSIYVNLIRQDALVTVFSQE